jgi:hypothetical protein
MERLLNNKTVLLSDNVVTNIKDLWAKSIDKEQRQALYRYWLWKYIQSLTGLIDYYLGVFLNIFF